MTLVEKMEFYTDCGLDPTGCWLWTGVLYRGGYAQVYHDYRRRRAHVVAWEIKHRCTLLGDLIVCHRCDVRRCVNPSHLFLGDHGDNARDRNSKGRAAPKTGENNGRARLTREVVIESRRRALQGARISDLAELHGVNLSVMRAAIKGDTWASVPDFLPMPDLRRANDSSFKSRAA